MELKVNKSQIDSAYYFIGISSLFFVMEVLSEMRLMDINFCNQNEAIPSDY